MDPLALMIHLQKLNSNALGFIPAATLKNRVIRQGTFLIATPRGKPACGFLIHSPLHPGRRAYVHQVCIDFDARRREHALRLVAELVHRATAAGAAEITLKCADDLDANLFWRAIGAEHFATTFPQNTRQRAIHHWRIPLETNPCPLFTPVYRAAAAAFKSSFSRQLSATAGPSGGSPLSRAT